MNDPDKPTAPASPLPFTGGAGGGPAPSDQDHPPLTPPAGGRGTGHTATDRAVSTRAIPRQATSAVAYTAPTPADDDPLLAFAPYLHARPRSNSITPERQRRFVATLAATGIVSQAARSIGKSMEALYKLRARPGAEGFAGAWDAALERGVQRLEDCALERSLVGISTPIVSGGEILGHWDKPDNTLLRFLLQHRLPEKYGIQKLVPGNPVYDSIRREVLEEEEEAGRPKPTEDDALAEIDAKLDLMRRRDLQQRWRERGATRAAARAERLGEMAEMRAALRGSPVISMPAGCVG